MIMIVVAVTMVRMGQIRCVSGTRTRYVGAFVTPEHTLKCYTVMAIRIHFTVLKLKSSSSHPSFRDIMNK
jgi:hypothetical protein